MINNKFQQEEKVSICLDSGNTLNAAAISLNYYNYLKEKEVIPVQHTLKRSNLHRAGPNGKKLKTNGILHFPIDFTDGNRLHFTLEKFHVISDLCNNFNFGKAVLNQLDTVWIFKDQHVTLLGEELALNKAKR